MTLPDSPYRTHIHVPACLGVNERVKLDWFVRSRSDVSRRHPNVTPGTGCERSQFKVTAVPLETPILGVTRAGGENKYFTLGLLNITIKNKSQIHNCSVIIGAGGAAYL